MDNSCWTPFDKDYSHELRWAYTGCWQNFQYVPYHVVVERQINGPCCYTAWGPLQMALVSGCEVTVSLVLSALANSVPWGHEVSKRLRCVNLKVFEEKQPWYGMFYSPNHPTLVERIRRGWKAYQICRWDVQKVIVAGRKQQGCVWSMVPKDVAVLILKMASEVVFEERKEDFEK